MTNGQQYYAVLSGFRLGGDRVGPGDFVSFTPDEARLYLHRSKVRLATDEEVAEIAESFADIDLIRLDADTEAAAAQAKADADAAAAAAQAKADTAAAAANVTAADQKKPAAAAKKGTTK